jgi:nitroreductase
MRGDGSAYAALGLQPGAEPADIDRAYKRLIKRYHPDREHGDASRAAEINLAYRELRGRFALSDPLILQDGDHEGTGNGWVRAAMALIVALAALFIATGPVTAFMQQLAPKAVQASPSHVRAANLMDSLDQPIHRTVIDEAVRDAVHIGIRNENALLNASQACARALRQNPDVAHLDRCLAFDDAVVQMQNRDPSWDGGPFSQLAVSRRQWSAATVLSNDYLAVDGRLDRIRVEVELALAATNPEPAAD